MPPRDWLNDVPPWLPPRRPLVVVALDPADALESSAGLVRYCCQRGNATLVIFVTQPGRARCAEPYDILDNLSGGLARAAQLDFPAGQLHRCGDALVRVLRELTSASVLLVSPVVEGCHSDHYSIGAACRHVARQKCLLSMCYPLGGMRGGLPGSLELRRVRRFFLNSTMRAAKARAMKQLGRSADRSSWEIFLT